MRIPGALLKLGTRVSATSIRTILRREGLGPDPRRSGPSWSEFLRAQAHGIVAFEFLTVETVWLQTMYVLFAIELRSRRVDVSASPGTRTQRGWLSRPQYLYPHQDGQSDSQDSQDSHDSQSQEDNSQDDSGSDD